MSEVQVTAIARRLRHALESRGRTLTWLHEQVKDTGVRGSSYGSVYAYVKGEAKAAPPLEFLEEAADALSVSPCWLAFGVTERGSGLHPIDVRHQVVSKIDEALGLDGGLQP